MISVNLKFGKQPMISRDKKHIISFNGEIYNYKELKKDLIIKGYKFFSTTDTGGTSVWYNWRRH